MICTGTGIISLLFIGYVIIIIYQDREFFYHSICRGMAQVCMVTQVYKNRTRTTQGKHLVRLCKKKLATRMCTIMPCR